MTNQHIDVCKQLVLRRLRENYPQKKYQSKIYIQEGIMALEERDDIIICPADKGEWTVILNKEFYHSQLTEMLTDKDTYTKLERDPTIAYRLDLVILVDYSYDNRVISKKEKRYLVPSNIHIPTIYTLPKVHKNAVNPPARPIVNSIGSVIARLGQNLDHFFSV